MSRSRRKTPIVGHTTCRSEREDKKLWHQRWRTHERTALKRQAATADRIANHKGRNPQERASLKKRLLRKWMDA